MSQKQQKDYISAVYDEKRTPKTDYPSQLIAYLIDRFALKTGVRFLEIGCGRGDSLLVFAMQD
jgi:cyclopropane fatty-acyl-phospholipid synthase-like methyltransferase